MLVRTNRAANNFSKGDISKNMIRIYKSNKIGAGSVH